MSKHYVFWPFESQRHVDLVGDEQGAGRTLRDFQHPSGPTSFVRYGSRKHRGRLANCNDPSKSLYVTGHGAPGWSSIANTPDASDETIHALIVVARLFEYGLRKTSACKLKLFTCYSGVDGANLGFARAMHDILRHLNFNHIQVFGYTAMVSPYSGNKHTTYYGEGPGGIQGLWNKASTVQIPIR